MPPNRNPQRPRKVGYGAQGLKMGVPQNQQRRNLPGGIGGIPNHQPVLMPGQSPPILAGGTPGVPPVMPGQVAPQAGGGNATAGFRDYWDRKVANNQGFNPSIDYGDFRKAARQAWIGGATRRELNPLFSQRAENLFASNAGGGAGQQSPYQNYFQDPANFQALLGQLGKEGVASQASQGGNPAAQQAFFDANPGLKDSYLASLGLTTDAMGNVRDPRNTRLTPHAADQRYGQNYDMPAGAPGAPARNQPGGQGQGGQGLSRLAQRLQAGDLPDRFAGGFDIAGNGKIVDTTVGQASAQHAAQYQKLYNAAKQAGLNITGGSGTGGAYDPNILYAQPNRYVDMRTGIANPTSTGASADAEVSINPAVLSRLRANAGYNEDAARASAANLGVNDRYPYIPVGGTTSTGPSPQTYDKTTDPVANDATKGYNTPQHALAAGKNPAKHVAYWASQGWNYNPANDQWTQAGNSNPKPNDPNGPQSPGVPVPPTAPQTTQGGWPIDPYLEAQRRMIEDSYAAQTAGIPGALSMLAGQGNLAQARLGTNEAQTAQQIKEQMAGRGTFNSSLYGDANNLAATDYARQHQDLAQQLAEGYTNIYGQQNQASLDMSQALQEALLNWANTQSQSQYAVTPSVRNPGRRPKRRNKRRRR